MVLKSSRFKPPSTRKFAELVLGCCADSTVLPPLVTPERNTTHEGERNIQPCL